MLGPRPLQTSLDFLRRRLPPLTTVAQLSGFILLVGLYFVVLHIAQQLAASGSFETGYHCVPQIGIEVSVPQASVDSRPSASASRTTGSQACATALGQSCGV